MVSLRPATPADMEAIAALLTEVDRYYGATEDEPIEPRLPLINEALFGPTPAGNALLAWDDDRLVGLAAYSFHWPAAGVTRSIFLKELYVSEDCRQHGVGRMLMSELCRIAQSTNCSRVEWAADTDNPIALSFYETLGVPPNLTKHFYRLDGEAIGLMASSPLSTEA